VKGVFKQGATLFLLLTLAGCASSGAIRQATPISTGIPVSVDFALIQTSTALTGSETETRLLNDLVISGLRSRGVFGDVDADPMAAGSSGGIKVAIKILEIKKISNDERQWAGALAGRARILVQATVSDLSSGKLVETFQAEGLSSGGSNLAGTTDEAVQRAAEQVVAEVIAISRRTGP
jgi:ABC-type phosphate transport system substrate-binding protein